MAPLRGGALRAGPTRIVEIPSSTARSVWDYTTSELRTLNVRDTAGSGIREKKSDFLQWLTPSSGRRRWLTSYQNRIYATKETCKRKDVVRPLLVCRIAYPIRCNGCIGWLVRRSGDGAGYVKTPTSVEAQRTAYCSQATV